MRRCSSRHAPAWRWSSDRLGSAATTGNRVAKRRTRTLAKERAPGILPRTMTLSLSEREQQSLGGRYPSGRGTATDTGCFSNREAILVLAEGESGLGEESEVVVLEPSPCGFFDNLGGAGAVSRGCFMNFTFDLLNQRKETTFSVAPCPAARRIRTTRRPPRV